MTDGSDRDSLTPDTALRRLADAGDEYSTFFEHGCLSVGIYKPVGTDRQKPHKRDEIYVIIAGRGDFVTAGERRSFEPGEVLFVAAGAQHRFENFDDEFSTWVFFYGPEGGEES